MSKEKTAQETKRRRSTKLLVLFVLLILFVGTFLSSIYRTMHSDRRLPSKTSTIQNRSLRGDIISKDNYIISSSYKFYRAVVHSQSIKPDKKELFIKLFSIYSLIDEESIKKSFYRSDGTPKRHYITLADDIDERQAVQLKSLALKLRRLGVFQSIKNSRNVRVLYGLDIVESGEARRYPLYKSMTPIIGYVRNSLVDGYSRSKGQKGLERYAQKHLSTRKDGILNGQRDVIGSIIRNEDSYKIQRIDGLDLHLNIPLPLQQSIEAIVDDMKIETGAFEILASVMESSTGKVLAMVSSQRYNPSHITQRDVPFLNPKFAEYPYEAGSVIKPLTLAIALDHERVTPDTWIETFNGKMKIGKRRTITDDEKFKALTATDIIVHSSNVGISQISWKLSGEEFRKGLLGFGLSQPSGIDLSRDLPGRVKSLKLLKNKMHRANQSYGYGMHVTFAQLLKAYSAFNNNGKAMTPRLIDYFSDDRGNYYRLPPPKPDIQATTPKTAKQIHNILLEVVKRGTGVSAQYRGLEIGGKTGTAHIATSEGYSRHLYHSSFFGFANDKKGHKYTIGVLVIKASKPYKYFASMSAVPTFQQIVHALVEYNYLTPILSDSEIEEQKKAEAKEALEAQKALEEYLKQESREPNSTTVEPYTKPKIEYQPPKHIYHKPRVKKVKIYRQKPRPKKVRRYTPPTKRPKRQEALFNDLDMF